MNADNQSWDVAIRTDGGGLLGTGHVVRCCSIAAALREIGLKVGFVCSDMQPVPYIDCRGFPVDVVNGQFDDIELTLDKDRESLELHSAKLVILDTLYATPGYLSGVSDLATTCTITPDIHTASNSDVILNYSGYKGSDYYATAGLENKLCLFGMRYAPLGVSYWDQKRIHPRRCVSRILVTSGGTDAPGSLPLILEAMDKESELTGIMRVVVVGKYARYPQTVLDEWSRRSDYEIHVAPASLLELQKSCDIAVTAAGTTIYELFALGVPVVCFALADNQHQVEALGGRIVWCGDVRFNDHTETRVAHAVRSLLPIEPRRALLSQTQSEIDFSGARRIAYELKGAIECQL